MELVGNMFIDKVVHYKSSWLPAREIVEAAIDKRYEVSIKESMIMTFKMHGFTSVFCLTLLYSEGQNCMQFCPF